MRRLLTTAAILATASLTLPAAATASSTQESIFEDEAVLLGQGAAKRNNALDELAELGVDTVRSLVYWRSIAPNTKRKPTADLSEPSAYAAHKWDALDDLVRGAHARGLSVLLSPSSPAPRWATPCTKGRHERSCRPSTSGYGGFVTALGKRYSGAYADENQGGGILPRVDKWSMWNEPNQPGWLYPQYERRRGRTVVGAAIHYRRLATTAIRALNKTGHTVATDQVLLGELAPIGRTTGSLATRAATPVAFLRDLLCLNSRGRRLRGSAARARGCSSARLTVSGFAHHPYTRGGSQPPRARVAPGEVTISSASRLKTLLDAGARAGRLPARLPLWYTEFGYQTNPPDTFFGVTLREQSQFLNEAEWIAYKDPRVRSVAQYKLLDEPNIANFQTGLRTVSGRAKPALEAYKLPIWVSRSRSSHVRVYGQLRPAVNGATETVDIQVAARRNGSFETVRTVQVASQRGHFLVRVPKRRGVWRLKWSPANGGAPLFSREARVFSR